MVLVNAPGMAVGAVIGGVVLTGSGGSYKAVAYCKCRSIPSAMDR